MPLLTRLLKVTGGRLTVTRRLPRVDVELPVLLMFSALSAFHCLPTNLPTEPSACYRATSAHPGPHGQRMSCC